MSSNHAEVIAFTQDKIKISVDNLSKFIKTNKEERVNISSYFEISNNDDMKLIAIIENYFVKVDEVGKQKYIIEAIPLGRVENGLFIKGTDSITVPLNKVTITTQDNLKSLYNI